APKPPPPKVVAASPKAEPSVARSATGEGPTPGRPPAPLAAWSLGAAVAGGTNEAGGLDPTLQLTVAGERKLHGLDLGLRLSGGVGTSATGMTPTGTTDVRHFPLRVGP